jgi:hypothetical protein
VNKVYYKSVSYEEALAAHAMDKEVKMRRVKRLYADPMFTEPWEKFGLRVINPNNYEFRIEHDSDMEITES